MATIIANATMHVLVSTVNGSVVCSWFGNFMFFNINNCPELDSEWNSMCGKCIGRLL
jgi:hypothetical protein